MKIALTNSLKHFIALVEYEDLQVGQIEVSSLYKLLDSAWCSHNDVRLLNALEKSNVLVDGHTTIDNLGSNVGKLLLESVELLLDLIGELSVVAENKGRARLGVLGKLMKDGENENSGFSHTRLSLAENVNTNHSLRDALLLHF